MTANTAMIPITGSFFRRNGYSIRMHPRTVCVGAFALAILFALIAATLIIGTKPLSAGELATLFSGEAKPSLTRSVFGRRLPRVITAAAVGALLGMSGATFQSISKNALGSPDIIGFTAGAATAAVFQIVVLRGGLLATAVASVLGGIVTALIVYFLSRRNGVTGGYRLVLVGIGVGAVVSAISSLLIARADISDATLAQLWGAGSLIGRGWPHAIVTVLAVCACLPLLSVCARGLTLIEMGDDAAAGLGLRVERTRFIAMLIAVIAAALATAAAGPIAFIAFAAGQIARRLVNAPGVFIGLSALIGSLLLVAADLLTQNLNLGMRTPVGLVTSVLGGLYLLWLLARRI
ncbi:FecCD family ABC transporter permease [Leucobacter sp. 1207-22]|uniref:FecCD family ABC transporter permease n=1 Tax=Leucobacter sp. 1207-22 TaxID=2604456 RepID=UPI0040647B16